jgi:hypothetical protein
LRRVGDLRKRPCDDLRAVRRGLVLAALAGCGGGIEPTIRFADLGDTAIIRMIGAAQAFDLGDARDRLEFVESSFGGGPCPAIAIDGDTATITGGCTTDWGEEVGGSATVTNPMFWSGIVHDPERPSRYAFHDYTSGFGASGSIPTRYDGSLVVEDLFHVHGDVTIERDGISIRSALEYECPSIRCVAQPGSALYLGGSGGALVDGYFTVSGPQAVVYTLEGADTLTVQFANGCVAWQISDSDRESPCI